MTAGRDRHLLSEPTGGLAPPPAVAPAGPPVLDLDFRDAAGFRWAFVPGGRRRLAEAPSPGGNRALPWPAPGSLPPTATFSHEPGWLMPRLSLALIRAMAAAHYGLPVTVIVSPSRTVAVVRARQAAMWLCRQLTSASLPQIGGAFGGRDHTTVIHAVMVVDALRQRDENFADDLDALAGHIRQSSSPRGRR